MSITSRHSINTGYINEWDRIIRLVSRGKIFICQERRRQATTIRPEKKWKQLEFRQSMTYICHMGGGNFTLSLICFPYMHHINITKYLHSGNRLFYSKGNAVISFLFYVLVLPVEINRALDLEYSRGYSERKMYDSVHKLQLLLDSKLCEERNFCLPCCLLCADHLI